MQPFKQSNTHTSGAAALLVMLNHFLGRFRLTKANEYEIWHRSALLPLKNCSVYALASLAKQNGLLPRVIVGKLEFSDPAYRFKGYTLQDVQEAAFMSKLFFYKAKKQGIDIKIEVFTLEKVKEFLTKAKPVILQVNAASLGLKETSIELVPLFGYSNNKFLMIDTFSGTKCLVPEEQMAEAFQTTISKCKQDPKMIVF